LPTLISAAPDASSVLVSFAAMMPENADLPSLLAATHTGSVAVSSTWIGPAGVGVTGAAEADVAGAGVTGSAL
jgi:hypothetical protein